ncbi:MAG TPA: DeoR family transcriptional regulator [Candidatus Dojkabacteria bacterium]|nr:DeoR family transcriptional regulator [Candidatus Dojkabacteria bacterium]
MKIPKYTLTNLMLNYIVKYEIAITDIKYNPIPEKYKTSIKERLSAEDIQSLGELVSYPIGYNKALTIQRGQEMPSEKKKLKLFTNFRNAKDFINSYNDTNSLKPSMELAVHINRLITKDIADDTEVGKLRTFSEKPNEIYDTWYKCRDFYPNLDPVMYFNEIFEWIQNGRDTNHKLIKTGVLLYEFMDKAPFTMGNQITAILTAEIITKKYGYNPENMFPMFKSINNISEDFVSAFGLSKGRLDLTMFLEAFLYTMSKTSLEVSNEIKDTYIKKVKKQGDLELHLNPRQIKIIDYLTINQKITRSDLTKMMGVSFMTSYRDLQDMLEKKYILQKGRGRGTFYVLNTNAKNDKGDIFVE